MSQCFARRPCRSITHAVQVGVATALLAISAGLVVSSRAYAADPTIAAVGDMACGLNESGYSGGGGTATRCRQRYVSDLIVNPLSTALLDLGDNQYLNGELSNYNAVYGPTFGRANSVVYPSPDRTLTSGGGGVAGQACRPSVWFFSGRAYNPQQAFHDCRAWGSVRDDH